MKATVVVARGARPHGSGETRRSLISSPVFQYPDTAAKLATLADFAIDRLQEALLHHSSSTPKGSITIMGDKIEHSEISAEDGDKNDPIRRITDGEIDSDIWVRARERGQRKEQEERRKIFGDRETFPIIDTYDD
ncbi:hypothetical protein ND748_02520 [Frankia sp. AiPs1]|uniref:hypothetical protein n=1 Tax=Frankia sp. AiPs1 TaxID=573493 RepID=UPI0020439BCF|nr:hypothetical protein [Frankia sp. AiPs1]MCM3920556.1 hypothetical protein [Frankia sp. AiPs1]